MTNHNIFFCDTYAILEIINGNQKYQQYLNPEYTIITSDYNLMELYYSLLKDFGEDKAEMYFLVWSSFSIPISHETIKLAMKFKFANKKDSLSYVDCIGYIFAQQNNIKFLTGDIKFKDKEGTEFVGKTF